MTTPVGMPLRSICGQCGDTLTFSADGRGWCHAEGGTYVMRCDRCGYKGAPHPSPPACPHCGSTKQWKDDHCVMPTTVIVP
jgi:primosomal protein N'